MPHNVAHRGEYIDAYSPTLSTVYGEVFWTMMAETPLPADFVRRFANKTVAITGYECDSVRILPNGTEQHVPIYDQYNHHHAAWVVGGGAAMVDLGPAGRFGVLTRGQRGEGRLVARPERGTVREHVAYHADGDRVAARELPFLHGVEELGGAQPLAEGDDGVAVRRHRLGGLREGLEVEARLLNARAGNHVLLGQRGEVARELLPAVGRVAGEEQVGARRDVVRERRVHRQLD